MIYPGSSPEFSILKTASGEQKIQVKYHCQSQGYISKWQEVPVVEENTKENIQTVL
jgi:hypothetical protein